MTALDQFDFHGRLEDTRGAVVVLFSAPGCASCRHWKRFLLDYAGTHTGLALYQVNVQQDMALAHEFGVFHLPAERMVDQAAYCSAYLLSVNIATAAKAQWLDKKGQ